ncbi:MAG: RNA polymerase sigma factor [Candidatus Kapabacteria bacterium]|jgi:RNA polymerase sigma-70 factor (ECF subfamily)|nr:RNA polymerase sigma factor [Candidatus Kapabacteria bacterium]
MKGKIEKYSDIELFELMCDNGKEAQIAFEEIYSRHSSRIHAYCLRFIGNKEEAQDVFQETFIRFFQSKSLDRQMVNLPAYLLRICRNLCISSKKSEQNMVTYEDYMSSVTDSHESTMEQNELLALVKMALDLLPEDYREIFVLREYNGLSYSDIAEALNDNVESVKVRIFRARQKVRTILAPYLKEMQNTK